MMPSWQSAQYAYHFPPGHEWRDTDLVCQIVYIPTTGLAVYGCLAGLGRLNVDLNAWQQAEAIKYYVIWILLYVIALATVKSSICMTIRRIASTQKSLKIAVWCLLAVTWASFLITFFGTLFYCRPVHALCKWEICFYSNSGHDLTLNF
jgi:uncharacterized membrane protein YhaH (DUF805 family)